MTALPPPDPQTLIPVEGTPSVARPLRKAPFIVSGSIVLALVTAALAVFQPWDPGRMQDIEDQFTVWGNPPSDEIDEIAVTTTMTETGRRIFFASLPVVEDAESFNEHCDIEDATVLGCYDGERIYVYNVTDERLAGTVEVTAAHEMLHAVYLRLSRDERREVDALVEAAVARIAADDPLVEVMETYPTRQHADEWHARLGTEVADIGPELEEYFAEFFVDRQALVELHQQSTAALRELEAQIEALVSELDALGAELDERSERYERRLDALNADIDDFNRRADIPGAFVSQAQFDAERAELIARSDELERQRRALNDDVDHYNELVEELEALDARYADLYSSLDSTPASDGLG